MVDIVTFLVKNGRNDIIPQRTLHVLGYRFENFVIKKHVAKNVSYLFVHCSHLHNQKYISKQTEQDWNIIEYLPLSEKDMVVCWKRSINDYSLIDCVIEEPIEFYLSSDGKNKIDIDFQAVLSLKIKK